MQSFVDIMEVPSGGSRAPTLHDEEEDSQERSSSDSDGFNGVLYYGVDQGVPYEVRIVSDDDEDTLSTPSLPSLPSATGTPSKPLRTEVVYQPRRRAHATRKRKRQSSAGDESIVSAIVNFTDAIVEIEKMKIQNMKKLVEMQIEHERKFREMMLKGQLRMEAIFADVLKGKDSSGSSK